MTFGYSLSSEAVIVRKKKEAVTKVTDKLTHEDFHGAFEKLLEQVHCSRRRILRRGLEIHVCTINKLPIRKKSGKLFNDPPIFESRLILKFFCRYYETKFILLERLEF